MKIDLTIIENRIKDSIESGDGKSDASWHEQTGVLLSISEASEIINYIGLQSRTITRLERQNRELQQACDEYRISRNEKININRLRVK